MENLDLLRKRLEARGGMTEGRMIKQKLKTLNEALIRSYQAERILLEDKEYRALINNNKLKMDYDDKIISIPFDSNIKVGDIFFWPRSEEYWIVYLRQYSEDAYFRGFIRKAQHIIKWQDEYGTIRQTYGAVVGPVETKTVHDQKKGVSYDTPNYTLSILVPNTELTVSLKRYSKILVDKKIWEVTATDAISEPGVIGLQVIEDYINKDEHSDLLQVPDIMEDGSCIINSSKKVKVETSLDNINNLDINEPFALWCNVKIDGVLKEDLNDLATFTIVEGQASISNDMITPLEVGRLKIKLSIPKVCFEKEFIISVSETNNDPVVRYEIVGPETVKSFGSTTYQIKKYLDGIEDFNLEGQWLTTDNNSLYTITSQNENSVTFNWKTGSKGNALLSYQIDNVIIDFNIKIESLI